MSDIGAAIAGFFAWVSTLIPAVVTPDWAALIGLLPLFIAPLVAALALLDGWHLDLGRHHQARGEAEDRRTPPHPRPPRCRWPTALPCRTPLCHQ